MMELMMRMVFFLILFLGSGQYAFCQSDPLPVESAGVFVEILDVVGIDDGDQSLSDNISFTLFFKPPKELGIQAYRIILEVNGDNELLNFLCMEDGSGLPDGVDIFQEEGIWYIETQSYTGINTYEFRCSILYDDGSESQPLSYTD